ncbi:GroES-like protein [Fomes fomentarius]|nr:GroES-like protein [Fomes fomentarius]
MCSMSVPRTMKALVIQQSRSAAVQDVAVPSIMDDEVLIQTHASVALNNVEWKVVQFIGDPGSIFGMDVAGTIVKVGDKVNNRVVGERVATFVHGAHHPDCGAFAQYVKTSADLVWVLPEEMSFEQGASMTCGVWTIVQGLFHPSRLGLTEPNIDKCRLERDEWIFVNGGSSSCGQYAIQLLHASGYKIATTSSPRNHSLVKFLGATAVIDHHALRADVVHKIKNACGDRIRYAIDCISTKDSQQLTQDVIAPSGGRVVILLPKEEINTRPNVERIFILLYTALGEAFEALGSHYPAALSDRAQVKAFCNKMPKLIELGKLRANPLKLWNGGLDAIPEGIQYIKEGKQHGEKIVYRL